MVTMTAQEVFDTAAGHLLAQGRRSVGSTGTLCMYRGPGGAKCAVGALIHDDEYVAEMEYNGCIADLVSAGLLPLRLHQHQGLLKALQRAHDESKEDDFLTAVSGRLRGVAARHRLSDAVLDEANR